MANGEQRAPWSCWSGKPGQWVSILRLMIDWKAWEKFSQAHFPMASLTADPGSPCQRHRATSACHLDGGCWPSSPCSVVQGAGGGNGHNWVSCGAGMGAEKKTWRTVFSLISLNREAQTELPVNSLFPQLIVRRGIGTFCLFGSLEFQ